MELKLHPKQMETFQSKANEILYGGSAGGGKAVSLYTDIITPSGVRKMVDIQVGDMVIGRNGQPTRVIAMSDIETPEVAYEIEFDTGDTVICDERHLWTTWTDKERLQILRVQPEWKEARRKRRSSRAIENPSKPWAVANILKRNAMARNDVMAAPDPKTRTTKEIVETLKVRGVRTNHSIPVCGPVEYSTAQLVIDPYLFGLWLGDGESHRLRICGHEDDVAVWFSRFKDMDTATVGGHIKYVMFKGYIGALRGLGVVKNKHIPEIYQRASIAQRMELLKGIMDTDGWCEQDGGCAIAFSNRSLIEGTRELVTGLGFKASSIKTKKTKCSDSYGFVFMANKVVFGLPRKVERQKITGHRQVNSMRYIISGRRVDSVPMRCIQVEDESGTYLVGRGHIVTHNSHLVRVAAAAWAYDCPGIQIYLFRRNFPDMEKNHLHGESGFLSLMGPWFQSKFVSYDGAKHIFKFANGSVIYLCHLNSRKDLQNYQGAEIHLLLLDEGTQFEEDEYRYLRARVRLGGWRPPERWAGHFPRIMITANPGGIGHMWVKAAFIDARPPMEIARMPKEEGGMLRQYIPARLTDNPSMDTDYASKLSGMGSPELVKAWLDGDWNVVAGTALEMLDKKKHAVRRFTIPEHWTRIMAMDWGTAKPFAIGWYAVVEGGTTVFGKKEGERDVFLPDGALVKYREYYGWNGKADTGCRMTSPQVAQQALKLESGERIDYRVGDSAMWAQTDGPSPQENMYTATAGKFSMRQAQKDREMNFIELRQRFIGEEGPIEGQNEPMLFLMEDLHHTWRTLPGLQLDELNPEKGPDSKQEDHIYDEMAYMCRSRPFKTTVVNRQEQQFNRLMKEAKKAGVKVKW